MADQPKKTVPSAKPIRYYISPLDSRYSSTLIEQIKNDQSYKPENDLILGSVTPNYLKKEIDGVRKIVDVFNY